MWTFSEPNPVTVLPFSSKQVDITFQKPNDMTAPWQSSCFEARVTDLSLGVSTTCRGSIVNDNTYCTGTGDDFFILANGETDSLKFDVTNTSGAPQSLSFEVSAFPHDAGNPAALKLNGLPPGTPVTGTESFGIGETKSICVEAAFDGAGTTHSIRLSGDVFSSGSMVPLTSAAVLTADPVTSSVEPQAGAAYALRDAAPNPFNPETTISFTLALRAPTTLKIYDVSGRLVRTLVDRDMLPGPHAIRWDGTANSGERVASGVYFYRLSSGEFTAAKKMVMLK